MDLLHAIAAPSQYQVVAPIVLGHPRRWPEPRERNPPEINWLDG